MPRPSESRSRRAASQGEGPTDERLQEIAHLAEAVAEALTPPLAAPAEPAPRGERFGLTRKELEVLRLLREGLTNREIGERLYISPRTAQTHVQNIMAKLDAGSRTAAATFAVVEGII